MRKMCILTALALILVAATANAVTVGIGAFGGLSFPIVNDQSEQGSVFGVRAPIGISPMFTAEAFYSQQAMGDLEESFGGPTSYTRDGGDVKAFGANAIFNFGGGGGSVHFFPYVGIGSYKIERSGNEDISDVGYNFGLGIGFGLPALPGVSFDVRGEAVMVKTDETSQKFGNVTLGATYKFWSTPTP